MADESTTPPVESAKATGSSPGAQYKRWLTDVELSEKEFRPWRDRVRNVLKRYMDDRGDNPDDLANRATRFNVLWSIIQTNTPALYAKTPKATVDRRYKDKDPIGRAGAQILERATQAALQIDQTFDRAMKRSVFDYQLGGRGVAWVRYVPTFKTETDQQGKQVEAIAWEKVVVDYVHWDDFGHNAARTWEEVRMGYRRHYYGRDECVELFGKDIGNKIKLDFLPKEMKSEDGAPNKPEHEMFAKATCYEIWDKSSRKRIWIAKGYEAGPVRTDDDPLKLEGFFPFPRPLYGTITTDSLVPIPDFTLYQDQASELDRLTTRMDRLARQVKVVGAYDAAIPELARILDDTVDGKLIPVTAWSRFAEKGGFEGAMDLVPFKESAEALKVLAEVRAQAKNDLYEITGQADIIRGSSDPNETATAQRIKGQFATLRLQERQAEVQRFARDTVELVAEIIATRFRPETLAIMASVEVASDPEVMGGFQNAIQLLRSDVRRDFRIDIETDTMIAVDEQAEKQSATELVTALGAYLEKSVPLAQMIPALGPVLGEVMLFAVRRFRTGRDLESALEKGIEQMTQMAQQPQQKPPDPKQAETEQKMQLMQADGQRAQEDHQRSMALKDKDIILKDKDIALADLNAKVKVGEILAPQEAPDPLEQEGKQVELETKRVALQKVQGEADAVTLENREKTDMQEAVKMAGEVAQVIQGVVAEFKATAAEIAQTTQALGQQVQELREASEAPREIVRDQAGRAAAIRVGGRERPIKRDASGRIAGLH